MMEDCPHMIMAVNSTHVKKKLAKDKKSVCQPCTFKAFSDSNELWCCLQCGNIGCGDSNAQSGDAVLHHTNVGDSDSHSIVLHLENDSKCWCFVCKAEIDNKSGHLKDIITTVKRNFKFPNKQNSVAAAAIPLPPPMPVVPPPPVIETPVIALDFPGYNKPKGNDRQMVKSKVTNPCDQPAGLTNLGNTCFMNSTLQCLASTRLLIPKLEVFGRDQELKMLLTQVEDDTIVSVVNSDEMEKPVDEYGSCAKDSVGEDGDGLTFSDASDLPKPLQITLEIGPETMTGRLRQTIRGTRKYETSKYASDPNESSTNNKNYSSYSYYNAYRPGAVHEMVAKNFRRGSQHDAHELLRTIVDMMKKDQTKAFRVAIMKHYGVKKGGEGSDPALLELVKSLDEKVKHKTFVDEVFGGELMTTQTCLTCKHVKRSHEQFLDLSLPLNQIKHHETEKKQTRKNFFHDTKNVIMSSLEECLQHFTEPELLMGTNNVECENCHAINLQKIESGMSPETVFPSLATSSEKSSSPSSPDSERKSGSTSNKKQEERKKRRNNRPNKNKNRNNYNAKETVDESVTEKEDQPGPSAPMLEPTDDQSLKMIENHFVPEEIEGRSEEPERSGEGDTSRGRNYEDYVVISSSDVLGSGSKRKIGDVDSSEGGDQCMEAMEEEIPPLLEDSQFSLSASSKQISESLQNLNLKMEGDDGEGEAGCSYAGEEDADFDLQAVDGIGGSASDEEGGNGIAQLDLGLPTYDKFGNFQVPKSIEEDDESEKTPLVKKTTTADEGFSEGENSTSVDNEATRRISQGPSGSSSRNSLSDSDEPSKSSSNDEGQKTAPVNPQIPKVTKCPCSRQQSISRPPEHLTIHFKRFQMTPGGYPIKIQERVNYPMILDLAPFCSPDSDKSDDIYDEDGQVLYSLYGIVDHSGTMNWGHYVAYVKSSEFEKRWFHISDSCVSVTAANRVTCVDAYILFYERIRGNEKTRRLSNSLSLPSPTNSIPDREKEDTAFSWDSVSSRPTASYTNFWDDKSSSSVAPVADENWDATDPIGPIGEVGAEEEDEIQIPSSLTDWQAEAGIVLSSSSDWNSESVQQDLSSNWSMPENAMKQVTEWGEGYQRSNPDENEMDSKVPVIQSETSSSLTFHRGEEEEEESKRDDAVLDLC